MVVFLKSYFLGGLPKRTCVKYEESFLALDSLVNVRNFDYSLPLPTTPYLALGSSLAVSPAHKMSLFFLLFFIATLSPCLFSKWLFTHSNNTYLVHPLMYQKLF